MNLGLFAMLAGFLLPLALTIRLAGMLAFERGRGWDHPLNLMLVTELLLSITPVVTLTPTAYSVVSGSSIAESAMLLDFTSSNWGLARLSFIVMGVLLADVAMPRVYDQLTMSPASRAMPNREYLLRDLGVLVTCLLLACVAAVMRA